MKRIKETECDRIWIYRKFLYLMLTFGIVGTIISLYYYMWLSVPSTIMIKAGVDQKLDFNIPATGELYKEAVAVSGNVDSDVNINDSVYIDLRKSVTIKANQIDQYKLQLKLFGMIPLKEVDVEVIQNVMLKPAGIPIGIYVQTKGVLVVGVGEFEGEDGQKYNPGKYIFQTGDYILEINDEEVTTKRELIDKISHCEGQEMVFKIQRGDVVITVKAQPELNQNGEYKMGIWVRDNAQGVGTMTYIDEQGCFGALGHGINIMGEITANTMKGIFGICSPEIAASASYDYMPIGLKQEIQKGPAQIICSLGGEIQTYQVEIIDINLEHDNVNRGIVIEITDQELLSITGGIVQGMSGSPIIQNDKLIGAVTHVLVQDPTKGYGIFIENMLMH